jgi:hypothetical protein
MIYQLIPSDMQDKWHLVKEGLKRALEDEYSEKIALNILNGLIASDMQCWIGFDYSAAGVPNPYAFVLTRFLEDVYAERRDLCIYSMANLRSIPADAWEFDFKAIRAFAQAKGCERIVAYSKVPELIRQCERMGFNSDYVYLSCPS